MDHPKNKREDSQPVSRKVLAHVHLAFAHGRSGFRTGGGMTRSLARHLVGGVGARDTDGVLDEAIVLFDLSVPGVVPAEEDVELVVLDCFFELTECLRSESKMD